MLNEKAVLLLECVIKNEYTNVNLDSKYFDENNLELPDYESKFIYQKKPIYKSYKK